MQLQGFATDDIFDIPTIQSVETMMGVDGVLSFGFVFKEIVMRIMLQADSASNAIFDTWWTQMVGSLITYPASGVITLPNISTQFLLTNGGLTGYKPAPGAKKLLQPREYGITWNLIAPAPTA